MNNNNSISSSAPNHHQLNSGKRNSIDQKHSASSTSVSAAADYDPHFAEPLLMTKEQTQTYVNDNIMMNNNNNNTNNGITTSEMRSRGASLVSNNNPAVITTNSTPPQQQNNDDSGNNTNTTNKSLPDLADCVFTPERVNAHALMNKWITVDETRNFALLRKERKAVVTFQCRIIVKGAKHIQLQIACGPSVDFLMPTWILIRYIQSELLPPCLLDEYKLVETWMRSFTEEVKTLSEKANALIAHQLRKDSSLEGNHGSNAMMMQETHTPQHMTRHVVHAAASVVNSTDLFLGLISSAKEAAVNGGGGGGAGGMMHLAGGAGYGNRNNNNNDDDQDEMSDDVDDDVHEFDEAIILEEERNNIASSSSNNKPGDVTPPNKKSGGVFDNLKTYLANRVQSKNNEQLLKEQQQRENNQNNNNNNNNQMVTPAQLLDDPMLIPPEQRILLNQVYFWTLIPQPLRNGMPQLRRDGVKVMTTWIMNVIQGLATCLRREEIRARFILPRPSTKEEFQAREVMREQVKRNRTKVAMIVAFAYLMICRYVSFDLFLIISAVSLYYVRYLFTEYKSIFMYFTKKTARSRVNRVKDWFTFSVVRRKAVNQNQQQQQQSSSAGLEDVNQVSDQGGNEPPDFDLEEWDFF